MSTGSAATSDDDYDACHRSTGSTSDGTCYKRFYEEEEEEGGGRRTKLERRGSRPQQKDPRQSQRNAANARERARMRVLSKAFSRLKTSLPWVPADTKLSKLDTLRLASSYISHLRQLLQDDHFQKNFVHPVNLTWPFLMTTRSEEDTPPNLRLCGATA
ncbi:musculin [Synchiropus splendidus]|uniref:musculin n=1 Tax=Synchiropus splendidus TaxID=270530 RepID=UPI00237E6A20|nr:musculin [Synchiropus splendidus]